MEHTNNLFKEALDIIKNNIEGKKRNSLNNEMASEYQKHFMNIGETLEENFVVEQVNKKLYGNLMKYFIGHEVDYVFKDEITTTKEKISNQWDLSKGILLMGKSGVGKDFTMSLFGKANVVVKDILKTEWKRAMCKDIPKEYSVDGAKIFKRYEKDIWYFSDLGEEDRKSANYSNSIEVMREIITSRYELWIKHKVPTHFSTNYNSTMLYQKYGERVFYRMNEMLNFAFMDGVNKRIK